MIDWTKPVRTKLDKIPVTVLTTKGRGVRPVIGYLDRQPVGITPENDIPATWGADGSHYLPWMELENVPLPPVCTTIWFVWSRHKEDRVYCTSWKNQESAERHLISCDKNTDILDCTLTKQTMNWDEYASSSK